MTTDKQIRFAFNTHGLGDVVHCAIALQLYKRRGYRVEIQQEPNKEWIWRVAGIDRYDPGQHDGEDLPLHPYYYPPSFWDLSHPDHSESKIAHLFEIDPTVLPRLGTKEQIWQELWETRLDATPHVCPEAHAEAAEFIKDLPRPIFVLHSKGTNWQAEKSIPDAIAFELLVKLLDTGGSVIVLDYDARVPTISGHPRVKNIKPGWGHIGCDRLCALLQRVDLMIGVDSGPFHVASLMTDAKCLGVFRKIPPVRCCLPAPNATYLVPAKDNRHWQARGPEWQFATYAADEPTAAEIAHVAIQITSNGVTPENSMLPPSKLAGRYTYRRVQHDERTMELLADGSIGEGAAGCERRWIAFLKDGSPAIHIIGDHGVICEVVQGPDGIFRGAWRKFEMMPIELIPQSIPVVAEPAQTPSPKPPRVVRPNGSPAFGGNGDAIVLAWVAEGSRGTDQEVQICDDGMKWPLLAMLGQPYVPHTPDAINPSPIYVEEARDAGAISRAARAAQFLKVSATPKRPIIGIPEAARRYADSFWGPRQEGRRRVLLCAEVNDQTRVYHHWGQLDADLQNAGLQTAYLTKHNCGTNWRHAAAIIDAADLIVAVDSAHAHLAGTLDRPTIVLCGPTKPTAFEHMPSITTLAISTAEMACVGCTYGAQFRRDECWGGGCAALKQLSPERIVVAVKDRLKPPPNATRSALMFRTYQQLAEDVRAWCRTLPEFAAVAGVPRAGVIVAGMIAAERNIHLVTLDELRAVQKPWEQPLRRRCPGKPTGDVLIVDDTVSSGRTMRHLRSIHTDPRFKFGVVYGQGIGVNEVDHCFKPLGDLDHVFDWNWQHHWFVEHSLFDLDGVLCEEWPHLFETGELAGRYLDHVANARCLMVPAFPIGEIVTARLEKYRPQTEAWLHKHGIQFHGLTMAPYNTPEERTANNGFAERKAMIYAQRPHARMFVESSHHQAEIIARLTSRPVLSIERLTLLNGANP